VSWVGVMTCFLLYRTVRCIPPGVSMGHPIAGESRPQAPLDSPPVVDPTLAL
jgi:hypothetical protein